MRTAVKILVPATVLAMAGVAAVLAVVVSGIARGPELEGSLALPGLSEPVEVLRDAHGIPYVYARNLPDLIRAQGFVTAQDRIFQLEAYRAIAHGRLAEKVGEAGLANDREIRQFGLVHNAARHLQRLGPPARDFLGWYAEGMNAYITAHAGDLPVELRLAGLEATPWTLQDLVTVLHYVNYSQTVNFKAELAMQALVDRLGIERARELFPMNRNPDRLEPLRWEGQRLAGAATALAPALPMPLSPAGTGVASAAPPATAHARNPQDTPVHGLLEAAAAWPPPDVGSNSWAIAPARAASGAAVVANDPHLDARVLPGIWHPVGLFSPEVQAVGAALPGVPGLLVGRNAHVAFGVTNAYGDCQDLFVEQPASGRPGHYLEGGEARPFERVEEVIRVKDGAAPGGFREERHMVRRTVRGPILDAALLRPEAPRAATGGAEGARGSAAGQLRPPADPLASGLGPRGDRLLSLRMASAEIDGTEIGLDRLLLARNAAEADAAVQRMEVFYFNFVFADKAGRIGHRASGRVPRRASSQGLLPKPAAAGEDWLGFIPAGEMPGRLDPPRGWIATANNDLRPDDYPHHYSSYAAPPYRAGRVGQVLDAQAVMTVDDHRRLQLDTQDLQAARLRPLLVAALRDVPAQADLAALLAAWDGRDEAGAAAPLLYHHLYEALAWETFVDDLGEDVAEAWMRRVYLWQERFDALLATPDSPWFDDRRTPAVERLDDLIRRVAVEVRAALVAAHGTDPAAWRWGSAHTVSFSSPLRRRGLGRDQLGTPPWPMSGSSQTVLRAGTRYQAGFNVELFASMRMVADLADDEKILAVVSGGVIDRQFHANQKDQLAAWQAGELLPWWFGEAQVRAHAAHRQWLEPGGR